MANRTSDYWRKRSLQLENTLNNKGVEYYHDLERLYKNAANETTKEINKLYTRLATENGISLSEAKKLLTGNELDEFRWSVEQYIAHGKKNAVDQMWMKQLENASLRYRISRLEAMKIHAQNQVEVLMGNELDGFSRVMADIYTDGYYRNAHLIQTGMGVASNFAKLDTNKISKVLSKPWCADGQNFSQRIWGNHRPALINDLHTLLTQSIIRGEAPDKVINAIAKKFDVAKNKAGNLVMTESAYFGTVAQQDCYKELDVELQEFVATLDNRTSDICSEMDGKVFKTSELQIGVNAPPLHCRCRSVLVPYFEDNITERAARGEDGKTVYVDGNMSYKDWYNKFVGGADDVVDAVVQTVKAFAPAKNLDEVKQRMTSALGNDTIDLKKMDLELANQYLEGVETFTNEYPMIKGFVKDVNTKVVSPRAYANIRLGWKTGKDDLVKITESKLCLRNPKDYATLAEKMANDIKTGFHFEGSSFKGTAAHELTHSLEYMVGAVSKGSYVNGKFIEIAAERPYSTFAHQIVDQAKRDIFGKTVGRDVYDGMKYLGKYAFTNAQETLAEAVSYELTVGTNPFSARVKELFDLKIKEVLK